MNIKELDNLIKIGLLFSLLFFIFGILYQALGGGECIENEGTNGCVIQDNLGLPLSMISLLISSFSFFIFTIKKLFRVRQNS